MLSHIDSEPLVTNCIENTNKAKLGTIVVNCSNEIWPSVEAKGRDKETNVAEEKLYTQRNNCVSITLCAWCVRVRSNLWLRLLSQDNFWVTNNYRS